MRPGTVALMPGELADRWPGRNWPTCSPSWRRPLGCAVKNRGSRVRQRL